MNKVVVEKHISTEHLQSLGVSKWPTWKKEVSARVGRNNCKALRRMCYPL